MPKQSQPTIYEVPVKLERSTASQFRSLIHEIRHNGTLSQDGQQGRRVPTACISSEFWKPLMRNPDLDSTYQQELKQLRKRDGGIHVTRKRLPVFEKREEILKLVKSNSVVVITGETGCGKTTQIPQFILDDYIERGKGSECRVVCCQPRRISAVGVAERVADERMEGCGGKYSTGYQIRFDRNWPRNQGCILFCTVGILQNLIVKNRNFSFCSHLIIDEVHERRSDMDLLITTIREVLPQSGCNLRLLLMSASLRPESFSEYFGGCPIIEISGFVHPVKKYMLEDVFEFTNFEPTVRSKKLLKRSQAVTEDFLDEIADRYSPHTIDRLRRWDEPLDSNLVLALLKYICRESDKGSILIFYPGWEEIHELRDLIREDDMFGNSSYRILILHSRIAPGSQNKVFDPSPRGIRKIIIATNIAESSITIDDVTHVIDCGFVKVSNFNPDTTIHSLDTVWISKANAQQRRGRAGRTRPGESYHLFTSHRESLLEEFPLPEMVHTALEEISLKSKCIDICDIRNFYLKVMDTPPSETVDHSILFLKTLGCIDDKEELTPLGSVLAQLPLHPQLGKMMLYGAIFSCLSPILTIVAVLDIQDDPFHMPKEGRTVAKAAKLELSNNSLSDHVTFARAFEGWKASGRKQDEFCDKYNISYIMLKIFKLRNYYCRYLYSLGFVRENYPMFGGSNKNSMKEKLVKAILCAGLYPNIAVVDRSLENERFYCKEKRVYLRPWSILNICEEYEGRWLVYFKRLKVKSLDLHDVSVVRPLALFLFGAKLDESPSGEEAIVLDGWIEFRSTSESLRRLREIRQAFVAVIDKIILDWKTVNWGWMNPEMKFIKAIMDLVSKPATTVRSNN